MWLEPRSVQSIRGERGSVSNRQEFAIPAYLTFPQDLHDPQIGGLVSVCQGTQTPRAAFPHGRRASRISQRIVKDPQHDPVKLSIRPDRRLLLEAKLGPSNGNASDAARRAGYAWPDKVAAQLPGKTRIQAAIDARMATAAISANEVLARLAAVWPRETLSSPRVGLVTAHPEMLGRDLRKLNSRSLDPLR